MVTFTWGESLFTAASIDPWPKGILGSLALVQSKDTKSNLLKLEWFLIQQVYWDEKMKKQTFYKYIFTIQNMTYEYKSLI